MKKSVKLLIMSLFSIILFSGCGNSNTSTHSDNIKSYGTNTRMKQYKEYQINKGDEIEKLSADTKIEINSDLKSGKTTAKLISGDASIIRY